MRCTRRSFLTAVLTTWRFQCLMIRVINGNGDGEKKLRLEFMVLYNSLNNLNFKTWAGETSNSWLHFHNLVLQFLHWSNISYFYEVEIGIHCPQWSHQVDSRHLSHLWGRIWLLISYIKSTIVLLGTFASISLQLNYHNASLCVYQVMRYGWNWNSLPTMVSF